MESFKHNNKEIAFWSKTGEVISQNKYSETHVSSSGAVGNVGPTVHSTTVTKHEFWIRKEDGSEESIQLSGHDVPLREGQKITLIISGLKGGNYSYYTILVNHSANKHWFLENANSLNRKLLKNYFLSVKSTLIIAGLPLIGFVISASIKSQVFMWFLIVLVAAFVRLYVKPQSLKKRWECVSKMKKDLNLHLESLAQAAHKQ